jgi:hypothetical protein
MKSQDQFLLEEAYRLISESKKKDLTGDGKVDSNDYLRAKDIAIKKAKAEKEGKSKKKVDESSLEAAYQKILESKYINKGFARRYNKVTSALLKAEPGSEEYQKLKAERDDLVSILKDHGKTPAEIQDLLVKKEKTTEYSPNTDNQYGDNTYSDTSDLESNIVQGDFSDHQTQEIAPNDVAVSQ